MQNFQIVRGGRQTAGWRSHQSDTSYTEYCWHFCHCGADFGSFGL